MCPGKKKKQNKKQQQEQENISVTVVDTIGDCELHSLLITITTVLGIREMPSQMKREMFRLIILTPFNVYSEYFTASRFT